MSYFVRIEAEDEMCQGTHLKASAASALRICARGNARPHLGGNCRLYARSQAGYTSLMCACGLVCILHSGEVEREQPFSLTFSTVTIDDAMNALATLNCLSVSLPLPRSMIGKDIATPWEQIEYNREMQAQISTAIQEAKASPFYKWEQDPLL